MCDMIMISYLLKDTPKHLRKPYYFMTVILELRFFFSFLGVPCACPSYRPCSIYDTCRRGCIHIRDRLGIALPILRESGTERQFEAANEVMKHDVDTRRVKQSSNTRQLEGSYRQLLKGITSYISHLVQGGELSYSVLKRWVYSLRFDLRARILERDPGVEKMLNEFYSRFYDTERLRKLMVKVEAHLKRPPTMKMALQKFEEEVDMFLSSRVFLQGVNEDGQQNAIFCVDPEWSIYPAHDLYRIHERVREALQRVRRQFYFIVFFCTVLTEYVLLNNVDGFAQKIKDRVERQPVCIDKTDRHATSPPIEEVTDTPSKSALLDGNEAANVEDRIEFRLSSNVLGNGDSVLVPGIEWVPSDIISTLASEGGWSSLEFAVSTDGEQGPLLISYVKPFYSLSP